jgi:hypothetical protein
MISSSVRSITSQSWGSAKMRVYSLNGMLPIKILFPLSGAILGAGRQKDGTQIRGRGEAESFWESRVDLIGRSLKSLKSIVC